LAGPIPVSTPALALVLALLVAAMACGGAVVPAPQTYTVVLPAPVDDPPLAEAEAAKAVPGCPADTLAEKGVCVRVVASPEIPAWEPPRGHGDPCATWTSEKGLVDCDPKNEDTPVDAGRSRR